MQDYQIIPQNPGFIVKNLSTSEEIHVTHTNYDQFKVGKAYKALLQAKKSGDTSNIIVSLDDDIRKEGTPKTSGKAAAPAEKAKPVEKTYSSEGAKTIHESLALKPRDLKISDLKWKFLMRSIIRAKNILMTGDAGSGKTQAAILATKAAERPLFSFNLGSTGDPRATLIGNTTFNKEDGTLFAPSAFISAIKTPNAVILLDEISRAHPDAWNILMTILDQGQRYVRLDEAPGAPIVHVDPSVCFIATANIGSEYTSTRVLDRAILDRFTIIEMDLLTDEQEADLLMSKYPNLNKAEIKAVASIAHQTRLQKETGRLGTALSTRSSVEICNLLSDDFNLVECAEIAIYPLFDADGGVDSERTFVKQLLQRHISSTN